jgi:hypothetical protein
MRLVERRDDKIKQLHLLLIDGKIMVLQGARIIGQLYWVPEKPNHDDIFMIKGI